MSFTMNDNTIQTIVFCGRVVVNDLTEWTFAN